MARAPTLHSGAHPGPRIELTVQPLLQAPHQAQPEGLPAAPTVCLQADHGPFEKPFNGPPKSAPMARQWLPWPMCSAL